MYFLKITDVPTTCGNNEYRSIRETASEDFSAGVRGREDGTGEARRETSTYYEVRKRRDSVHTYLGSLYML